MELDVRTKDGNHKVSLYGDIAELTFKHLAKREDVKIDSKIFGGKSINCFVSIPDNCIGFRMTDMVEITLLYKLSKPEWYSQFVSGKFKDKDLFTRFVKFLMI